VAACFAFALLVSACARGTSLPGPKPTAPFVPSGTLLLDLGGFDQRLVQFRLPQGPMEDLVRRSGGEQFFGYRFGAAWGSDGYAYSLVSVNFGLRPDVQLLRVKPGSAPRAIGAVLVGGTGFAFRDHVAVTWTCAVRNGQVYVMDVRADHPVWKPIARGCEASISPDAGTVAFMDQGSAWKVPVSGGTPTRVLDLRSMRGLPALGIERSRPGFAGTEIGAGGMAVTVGAQGKGWVIVVVTPGRQPQVVPLGTNEPGGVEWQPGGRLLAFGDFVADTQAAEVRLFDPQTGAITQLATAQNFGRFVWSPDGRVLGVARSASIMAFVDPATGQVGTAPVSGAPDDWAK
jgi:hypothetical protein